MVINATPMAKCNAAISHKAAELSQQIFGLLLVVSVCTTFIYFFFLSQVTLAWAYHLHRVNLWRNLVAKFWWAVRDFFFLLGARGDWHQLLSRSGSCRSRGTCTFCCELWVQTSGKTAWSQMTGVLSGGAFGGWSEITLLLIKGEGVLCAPCHLPATHLTPAQGLQEPGQLSKVMGKELVFGRRGELRSEGWVLQGILGGRMVQSRGASPSWQWWTVRLVAGKLKLLFLINWRTALEMSYLPMHSKDSFIFHI